jgi:Thioredoxin-like
LIFSLLLLLLQPVAMQTEIAEPAAIDHSGHVFDESRNAQTDVDVALDRAKTEDKMVLLIMGANWCHDSRDLATWLESPRFKSMLDARYVLVFVDVGKPQTGDGRNLNVARRFGIKTMKTTPLVVIASPTGIRLNSKKDAIGWRNAASRSEDEVFRHFAIFTPA